MTCMMESDFFKESETNATCLVRKLIRFLRSLEWDGRQSGVLNQRFNVSRPHGNHAGLSVTLRSNVSSMPVDDWVESTDYPERNLSELLKSIS